MQRDELFGRRRSFNDFSHLLYYRPERLLSNKMAGVSSQVKELQKCFHLSLDIPGVTIENLSVLVEDEILKIKGERKSKYKNSSDEYETISSFEKTYTLPKNVNLGEIEVSLEYGVLDIIIPKVVIDSEIKPIEIKSGPGSLLKKLVN